RRGGLADDAGRRDHVGADLVASVVHPLEVPDEANAPVAGVADVVPVALPPDRVLGRPPAVLAHRRDAGLPLPVDLILEPEPFGRDAIAVAVAADVPDRRCPGDPPVADQTGRASGRDSLCP